MQPPSREARYLGPATNPLTYSFPGGHRVWETAEVKVNQYATPVASNPHGMPSTREHQLVYSESDPMSEDEDDPYALPWKRRRGTILHRSLILIILELVMGTLLALQDNLDFKHVWLL